MKYQIKIEKDAQKFLKKLPHPPSSQMRETESSLKAILDFFGCVSATTALFTL